MVRFGGLIAEKFCLGRYVLPKTAIFSSLLYTETSGITESRIYFERLLRDNRKFSTTDQNETGPSRMVTSFPVYNDIKNINT
jgi:hypothetical protein